MKQKLLQTVLWIAGLCPFIVPVLLGLYRMQIESWALSDWLILYSFIYWPTYVAGALLIALAVFLQIRQKRRDRR